MTLGQRSSNTPILIPTAVAATVAAVVITMARTGLLVVTITTDMMVTALRNTSN